MWEEDNYSISTLIFSVQNSGKWDLIINASEDLIINASEEFT